MRTAIVTGANAGVGRHTALGLARLGFRCLLACRSPERGNEAAEWIRAQCNGVEASLHVETLDLSDLVSVATFAERVRKAYPRLDVLVLNAGIGGLAAPNQPTKDGYQHDHVYRTNFVGHFLLVRLLWSTLEQGAPSRIVCVSSVVHRSANACWGEHLLYRDRRERTCSAYSASKLAMAVLAAEVSRRGGRRITGVAVNPGAVNSEIWTRGDLPRWQERFVSGAFRLIFLTAEQGAATSISAATEAQWAATDDVVTYLCPYWTPWSTPMPFELHGPFAGARRCQPHPLVFDSTVGAELWDTTSVAIQRFLPSNEH